MSSFALLTLNKLATDDQQRSLDAEEGVPPRTDPTHINVFAIRCFYPRKNNLPGTRITFTDGGGFAVAEPVEYVREAASLVAKGKPQPAPPQDA